MTESSKPRYVDRDNEIVYRPPYLQADTMLTGWFLPSDLDALQALLDQALNEPSGGAVTYRPLSSSVLLVLANIKRVSSLDPRDAQRGWIPEQDICFWMLCGAYKQEGGREVLDHVAFYVPYIWVTNAYTMATGREAFGYPKSFGWAEMASAPTDPGPFWADALVIPTYTKDTQVTRHRILEVTRDPGSGGGTSAPLWAAGEGMKAAHALLDLFMKHGGVPSIDWNFIRSLVHDVLGGHMPIVFLKQFRDAVDPTAACYQAIVEADASITEFRGGGLLDGPWTVDIQQYASVKILDHLKIPASQKIELGFWVDYSFSMDLGKEVWRAP